MRFVNGSYKDFMLLYGFGVKYMVLPHNKISWYFDVSKFVKWILQDTVPVENLLKMSWKHWKLEEFILMLFWVDWVEIWFEYFFVCLSLGWIFVCLGFIVW